MKLTYPRGLRYLCDILLVDPASRQDTDASGRQCVKPPQQVGPLQRRGLLSGGEHPVEPQFDEVLKRLFWVLAVVESPVEGDRHALCMLQEEGIELFVDLTLRC